MLEESAKLVGKHSIPRPAIESRDREGPYCSVSVRQLGFLRHFPCGPRNFLDERHIGDDGSAEISNGDGLSEPEGVDCAAPDRPDALPANATEKSMRAVFNDGNSPM